MNYFPTGRTIELEKEVGTIFKKKIKKKVPIASDNDKILSDPKNVNVITKRIRETFEMHNDESIKRGLFHTYPPPYFDEGTKRTLVISPTEYDYTAINNFFSLLGAIIGAQSKDNPKNIRNKLKKAFFESWNILRERGYLQEYGEILPEVRLRRNNPHTIPALLHPPWEKLKKDRQFLDVVLNTYSKHTGIPREKIEQHLDDIIKAVDAVTEAAMKHDDLADLIERGEIPELERVLHILAGKKPEEVQPAKFKQVQKQVEAELRAKGVPEDEIYKDLEKKGIPRELAKIILDVKAAETTPTSQIHRRIEQHVGRDPRKAKAVLEVMERTGKLVPVPKYWANIVSKIATGEIKEKELLEALAVSKVFHTAYSKAIAKAAERDEPENTLQRMMFIKKVLDEAHRETMEALKEHPVYGEFIRTKAPAIEREIKATAETLSKTYYAKARGDPSLSAREFLQMELNPTVETLAPLRKHLKKLNEDFLAMGRPQEETISKVYPEMVGHLTRLGMSPFAEKEYVGITHKHEIVRRKLREVAR